jgi:epoxyqueuosine reductase
MKSSACTSSTRGCKPATSVGVIVATPAALGTARQIKEKARSIGFDLVGIAAARESLHSQEFHDWLASGFHGEMGYMARNAGKRVNPVEVSPGARSMVVAGLNYYTGDHDVAGRVARYAWGARDYHDVLSEKLQQLSASIDELGGPETRSRWHVDTGPILERDFAQRAGIGFIGKHTNLINRQLGNWIFLGEVLTSLELPPDQPEGEYCGTCHRCIDACPTRAIVGPYQLDARLCISYLTIELKGSIPVELRPLIGDHVFGCDDCLEACPWNRFAKLSPAREFQCREMPSLTEFLSWDEPKFRDYFRGTPIFRIKRRGFLRNVCVVLGNIGDASVLPALERAGNDVEPLVREHAGWAAEQIRARAKNLDRL